MAPCLSVAAQPGGRERDCTVPPALGGTAGVAAGRGPSLAPTIARSRFGATGCGRACTSGSCGMKVEPVGSPAGSCSSSTAGTVGRSCGAQQPHRRQAVRSARQPGVSDQQRRHPGAAQRPRRPGPVADAKALTLAPQPRSRPAAPRLGGSRLADAHHMNALQRRQGAHRRRRHPARGLDLRGAGHRQLQREDRAMAGPRVHPQRQRHQQRQPAHDRQSQPTQPRRAGTGSPATPSPGPTW